MTDYIGDELVPKVIRVTKGADRKFSLRRKDKTTGQPKDWDAEVYLNIDTKPEPTQIPTTVTGNLAVVRIEAETVALVKNTTTWQIIMSEPDAPLSLETPLAVGTFLLQNGSNA